MTRPTRRSVLRWVLLAGGIVGLIIAATIVGPVPFDSSSGGTAPVEAPPPPRPPLVVPTDSILDTGPMTFSGTLSLPAEPAGRSATAPSPPEASAERADERREATPPAPAAPVTQEAAPTPSAAAPEEPSVAEETPSAPRYTGLAVTYDAQRRRHRMLQRKPNVDPGLELGGLVVDETITPHGRTFYDQFYGVWRAPPVEGFYTVEIREKPTPGRGTLIQVFVNDDITFQARLQPRTEIRDLALQAARRTYAFVRSGRGILRVY